MHLLYWYTCSDGSTWCILMNVEETFLMTRILLNDGCFQLEPRRKKVVSCNTSWFYTDLPEVWWGFFGQNWKVVEVYQTRNQEESLDLQRNTMTTVEVFLWNWNRLEAAKLHKLRKKKRPGLSGDSTLYFWLTFRLAFQCMPGFHLFSLWYHAKKLPN